MASRKEYEMLFQLDAKLGSSYTSTFSKAKSGPSELQKEIRSLQSVQADISAYTKQQAAVEKTQVKLDNLNKQYQLLQQEIKETSGPTTSLERESAKLEQRIGDTSNALAAQKEKLGATAKSLNEAGVGTDNLGAKSQDLADKLNTLRAKEEAAAESAEEYGDKGTSSIEAVSQAFAAAKVYEALEQIKDSYMDITKFFFRIPTEVQLRELGRPLDDADMMWFFERAIRCDGRPLGLPLHCTDVTTAERIAGRGMQVGSLVSQMTANVVMTPADHYIKRELCAPYYARYMDDMGAIIEGKAAAWELVEEVDNYLQTNLGLNLNQKTAVIPIGNPVEFVGRKISPVKIELRRQTTLGMKKHLRYVQDAYAAGEIDLDYALSVITSYRGLFKDVTSDAFLEKMLDEFVLSRPALEA